MTETHVAAAVKICCGVRTSADRVVIHAAVSVGQHRTAIVYLTEEMYSVASEKAVQGRLEITFTSSRAATAETCVAHAVLGRRPRMPRQSGRLRSTSPSTTPSRGLQSPSDSVPRTTKALSPPAAESRASVAAASPKHLSFAEAPDAALRAVAQDLKRFVEVRGGSMAPPLMGEFYHEFPNHKAWMQTTQSGRKYSFVNLASDFPDLIT